MGDKFYYTAKSLLGRISPALDKPFFANLQSEKLDSKSLANFEILESFISSKSEISYKYNGYDFVVKPLKLVHFDGFWYLLVFDSKKVILLRNFI